MARKMSGGERKFLAECVQVLVWRGIVVENAQRHVWWAAVCLWIRWNLAVGC